mmetsp:Transcript_36585/g.85134  ORF Transcript_36585/g.85134 Transcript_36585/m.85134 type:complete len:234 (-) Transcript_36585:103-804(-)|eukprot:CAMPEP_0171068634 /NCGR_PEP_ID=MMETSP0766_2-20121228/8684_1 /TAXON_ID=439317 /ORGANISM="Gambierdiscus australes, Strain CAWD 149" /LENGTH=233 /DNA_ID=CAMNT_0011524971 /DNA_START=80 /DNA_END=781 /DNA_ORIENTATION=-
MQGPRVQVREPAVAKKKQSQRLFPGSTMLVVRNIPCTETIDHLQQLWPSEAMGWNYLYLPYSVSKGRSMGYAFINFADHQHAVEFAERWHQLPLPSAGHAAHRPLSVSASTVQSVGDSLTSIQWELLLQLADIGMEPVVLLKGGRRVDTRFAYFALSRPRLAGSRLGPQDRRGLPSKPMKAAEDNDGCTPGVPEGEVPRPGREGVEAHPDSGTTSGAPEDDVPWPFQLATFSL